MSVRNIVVCGCRPEYRQDDDKGDYLYVSLRELLAIGKYDVIFLPDHPSIRRFVEFACKYLWIREDQVRYLPGTAYLLDYRMLKYGLILIPGLVARGAERIVLYSGTRQSELWTRKTSLEVAADPDSWSRIFNRKQLLHPNFLRQKIRQDTPLITDHVKGLSLPRGYYCANMQELLLAAHNLFNQGIARVIIKPDRGTTGEGQMKACTVEEVATYTFPMGPVVVEECLDIDRDSEGREVAVSVQFDGPHFLSVVAGQRIGDKGDFQGNTWPAPVSDAFQEEVLRQVRAMLDYLQPQGPGGFDFVSVKGKPVLIDPNLGRRTGAMPAYAIWQRSGCAAAMSWKCSTARRDIEPVWIDLVLAGLAFDQAHPEVGGLIPIYHIRGLHAMWIAVGESTDHVNRLYAEAQRYLS